MPDARHGLIIARLLGNRPARRLPSRSPRRIAASSTGAAEPAYLVIHLRPMAPYSPSVHDETIGLITRDLGFRCLVTCRGRHEVGVSLRRRRPALLGTVQRYTQIRRERADLRLPRARVFK